MKFKGKVAPWYWAILIIVNGMVIYFNAIAEEHAAEIMIYAVIADFVLLPFALRNYVRLENGKLTAAFGFGTDTVKVRDITEISRASSLLATSAASFDRIAIKTKEGEIICAVKKKEELLAELKKQNKRIKIMEDVKKSKKEQKKKDKKK